MFKSSPAELYSPYIVTASDLQQHTKKRAKALKCTFLCVPFSVYSSLSVMARVNHLNHNFPLLHYNMIKTCEKKKFASIQGETYCATNNPAQGVPGPFIKPVKELVEAICSEVVC